MDINETNQTNDAENPHGTIDPGTTPGSAEGVDTDSGEEQSSRIPAENASSSQSVENGALDADEA